MRAVDRYAAAPLGDRLHVRVRWRSCPFAAVEAATPAEGRILDLGCGHGLLALLLALTGPARAVTGGDLDADKIAVARRAAVGSGDDPVAASFLVGTALDVPTGPWDAVVVVDVLYLLDGGAQRRLVAAAARELAPGGLLVVKEMSRTPRWKFAWNRVQEQLAVRVLRITEGQDIEFLPDDALPAALTGAGLDVVEDRRVDRGYLHPHRLVVARRPPTGA
ncbi:MAG: methyltransferase domain-containing protein [Acidimicrobiia bacterium]